MKFIDLTGKKFGRLTVVEYINNSKWLCKCDCGNEKIVTSSDLNSGHTVSCGCFKKTRLGIETTTHGLSKNKTFQRLYKIYGQRNICMCDEWKLNFLSFYKWALNNNYQDNLTIDRINVNGNYEPNNCRWTTLKQQARNTRKNVFITYKNETHCIAEWSEILSISPSTISNRLKQGYPLNIVLSSEKLPYNFKNKFKKL